MTAFASLASIDPGQERQNSHARRANSSNRRFSRGAGRSAQRLQLMGFANRLGCGAKAAGAIGREVSLGDDRRLCPLAEGRRSAGSWTRPETKKKVRNRSSALFLSCPRECRQAGILNLDSVGSLSSRIRYARHVGHTQQQFRWSATDANKHWSKESMTLTNTAGNSLEGWEELYAPVTPRFAAASVPPQVPPP